MNNKLTDHDRLVELHTTMGFIKENFVKGSKRMDEIQELIRGMDENYKSEFKEINKWRNRLGGAIAVISALGLLAFGYVLNKL